MAAGVVAMCLAAILFDQRWLLVVICYGFAARVLSGPTLSPLGLLVTRVIRPRLGVAPRPVPGPPKRFAQGMGFVFSATAAVLVFGFGLTTAGDAVLAMLAAAAGLEAFFALCLGCRIFAGLMRLGVIPREVCTACDDVWSRPRGGSAVASMKP